MAYSISCASMGADCPGSFTTESRDELVEHAVMHTKSAHEEMDVTDEFLAELDAKIVSS